MTTTEQAPIDVTSGAASKYIERVRKLLDRAERGSTQAERDEASAMAQKLMEKHHISDVMLGATTETPDEIKVEHFMYTGTLGASLRDLATVVFMTNGGKVVYTERSGRRGKGNGKQFILMVTGFESDLQRAKVLDASIRLQVATAMAEFDATQPGLDRWQRFTNRREFLQGYRVGLCDVLAAAKREARTEAVKDRAAETHTGKLTVEASLEVALRSRRDSVSDWHDSHYAGSLCKARGGAKTNGSAGSFSAGCSAGSSASIGGASVGATAPRAIGR